MNNIKFRAFIKTSKCYVMHLGKKDTNIAIFDLVSFSEYISRNNIKNIDCFEIQLYTGLKDTNGKEIYEGDVVEFQRDGELTQSSPCIVRWHEDYAKWVIADSNDGYYFDELHLATQPKYKLKVIGDVFENKKQPK